MRLPILFRKRINVLLDRREIRNEILAEMAANERKRAKARKKHGLNFDGSRKSIEFTHLHIPPTPEKMAGCFSSNREVDEYAKKIKAYRGRK